jgi:hypothetical protein
MQSSSLRNALVVAASVLALSAGAAGWLRDDEANPRVAALEGELAAARDAATKAERERATLAAEVARLEAQLEERSAAAADIDAAPGASAAPEDALAEAAPDDDAQADAATSDADTTARGILGRLDVDRLVASGFNRQEIDRFRARVDDLQLRRLYLRDRAAREGWIDTPRFAEESSALDAELFGLRTEFEEPLYDWMLYSMGHPNRVAVLDVIPGSAGESAGLVRGDVIVRYDDRLMLSATELRDATLDGRAGETVEVEVQRAGEPEPQRVFLPRGPMGLVLGPTALEPSPAS